ncbi:MAG TPA: histidine kinase [Bacillota bacterium]|nr:histidine kinase [Clostridiaceae bacterium]HNR04783.1 histidine kinase [Bacillota bacterium]HNT02901.1 histidine kinase [Bacillota bacterium]HPA54472.1 histidine kinase [Bacillota bacterium]HPX69598.1 histidine kinase [Bacillota bacterium]
MKNYKSYIIYLLIISLISLIIVIEYNSFKNNKGVPGIELKAKQGILDLTDLHFDDESLHSLDGEWSFFYNQFIMPDNYDYSAPGIITVPGLWNSYQYNKEEIGASGYGTYRLKVLLPSNCNEKLALKIPDMSSSYRFFVNGKEISHNGVVGKSIEEETPQWKPLIKTLNTDSGQLDIVIHVSNFHHVKGGIWESIILGTEEAIYKHRELNLLLSFILIGVLFISVFYYLVIFSVMQSNVTSLYLAMFSFMAGLRELLIREAVVFLIFPDISFKLMSKLEYITVPSGPLLLALSLYSLYQTEFPRKIMSTTVTVFSLYIIVIIFTPLKIFGPLMHLYLILFIIAFIYMIFVIAAAAKKKKPGAGTLLFGTLFLLLTALIDMGYVYKLHNNYDLAYTFSIGLIIFILCQMHSLSLNIADVFQRAQGLAKAEMAFLQAQIVPHFLYNTLNTIIHLTRESPEKARSLLMELSKYLHGKFNFDLYNKNKLVTLEYELDIVKSYLAIESVRFSNRLKVNYQIDEQTLNHKILPFLLQPLVENAVRHGFRKNSEDCIITISAFVQEKNLILSVSDNGIGMPKNKILALTKCDYSQLGTGLTNINQRLNTAYGTDLSIVSTIDAGTTINIKIPLRSDNVHDKSNIS